MKRKKEYVLRRAAGEYYLFRTDLPEPYEKPHILNETAAQIYKELAKGREADEIAKQLSRLYGISEEELLPDVEESITQLSEYFTA